MDFAGGDSVWVLAGVGFVSGAGCRTQLGSGGRAGRLADRSIPGFAAHWNKNSNFGNAFDVWFLNLFPRTSRFAFNGGGYLTLSFIPTLGTMLLGLIAGRWFIERAPKIPLRKFAIAAVALMAAGLLLHFTGVCPIVKRIWTPAWTLWSGGVCFRFSRGVLVDH